ncbi:MAG: dipeptidase [Phycisphaerae bacterium]|nr:dipeptidase [Phycisphaerae bacterium]
MKDTLDVYIENNKGRFIEELKDLLRFASVSAQRSRDAETAACAQWVRQHLADLGLDSDLVDQGGQPIVVARAKGRGPGSIVIYGHYDVQPEDPIDQWRTKPFEPVEQDGVLYARGATDDKGQFFAHVKALEALIKTQGELPCDVVFLLEGEEESGGEALVRYVRSDAGRALKPDALIISDGDMNNEQVPAITYGLRGIITFEIHVKGPGFDLHSGGYGGAVANPAVVLTHLISQCVSQQGEILIPGFYDDVQGAAQWELENMEALRFDDEVLRREVQAPALIRDPEHSTLERLWVRPTFEINGIYGGYQGQHSKTIIPREAFAKVSVRLVPGQTVDRVRDRVFGFLRDICPETVTLELTFTGGGPPVVFEVDTPAMKLAAEALKHGFDHEPVFIRTGGSIPVVSTFSEVWGCPVILMGLGLDSDGAHSPNEHFSLTSFVKGIKASARLLSTGI